MHQKLEAAKAVLKSRRKRNKLFVILGAVILVFAAMFTLFIQPLLEKDRYVYKETLVGYGDLVLGIQESGSLNIKEEAISYDVVITEDDSDDDDDDDEDEEEEEKYLRIEDIYVAAGENVEAGAELMKFTDSSVTAVRKKLASVVTEAEVSLTEAKAEYNIGLLNAKSTYDVSLLASGSADSVYQAQQTAVNAGLTQLQQKLVVLQGEIDGLKEDLEDGEFWDAYEEAEKAYNAAKEDMEEVNINSPAAYTARYSTYTKAKSTYEQMVEQVEQINESIDAKQHEMLEVQEEINRYSSQMKMDSLEAEQTQESNKLDGETAESIYGYTVDSLEEAVTAAENTLKEAEDNLALFDSFIGENNTVCATEAGKIISILYEVDDEIITTGNLLTYSTGTEETITVDIAEEDIVDIQVGDAVSIEFTAYPDEIYEGTISEISTKITDSHASTVNYPVTIAVSGDTSKLYGGMAADVTFAVETREAVLYVPKNALVKQDDNVYVYQKNSLGQMELVPVKTGFSNGVSVEITEGLSEGETVYIASKVASE